jgi:hypothetical protein
MTQDERRCAQILRSAYSGAVLFKRLALKHTGDITWLSSG